MLKYIIGVIIIIVGINLSLRYYDSEKFQNYADDNNLTFTCGIDKIFAELNILLSRYKHANKLYQRIARRCAKSERGIQAEFRLAEVRRQQGQSIVAIREYENFAKKYPKHKLALKAQKRARILSSQN